MKQDLWDSVPETKIPQRSDGEQKSRKGAYGDNRLRDDPTNQLEEQLTELSHSYAKHVDCGIETTNKKVNE